MRKSTFFWRFFEPYSINFWNFSKISILMMHDMTSSRNILFLSMYDSTWIFLKSISDGKSGLISKKNPEFVWLHVTSFRSSSYKYLNLVLFRVPYYWRKFKWPSIYKVGCSIHNGTILNFVWSRMNKKSMMIIFNFGFTKIVKELNYVIY